MENVLKQGRILSQMRHAEITTRCTFRGQTPIVDDRYELQKDLGKGGVGWVFMAKDAVSGQTVAAKFIREEYLQRRRAIGVEAEALARIDHPGIVKLLGVSEDEVYLVLEYVEGKPLNWMRPTVKEVIGIGRGLCDAVSAAHEAGVIHRDLKPENVMVQRLRTGELRTKLLDFGSALVRNSTSYDPYAHSAVGTAPFMAPEVIFGGGRADERTDVFSLGALLYEKLAGKHPFNISSFADHCDALVSRANQKPIPLARQAPELHPRIHATIDKALMTSPAQRYQSVSEFGEALGLCA